MLKYFFSADSSKWIRADFSVELMRHVSVGKGGIFAVKAKDDSVWYRTYEQGGKPAGKVQPNTDHGALWNKIQVGSYHWMSCCYYQNILFLK
jgi:hypothetical protein